MEDVGQTPVPEVTFSGRETEENSDGKRQKFLLDRIKNKKNKPIFGSR